jgi:hypothetical protein
MILTFTGIIHSQVGQPRAGDRHLNVTISASQVPLPVAVCGSVVVNRTGATAREPIGPPNRPSSEMITMRGFGPEARWLLPTAALVLVSASCGVHQAGTSSAQPSGPVTLISGVVEARPGCPVERPSRMCKPRPLGDVRVEARSLAAGMTASARTRADGRYSFRLGQGRYVLVAVTRQVLPRCPHVLVSVTSPAAVRENINCDSGIR